MNRLESGDRTSGPASARETGAQMKRWTKITTIQNGVWMSAWQNNIEHFQNVIGYRFVTNAEGGPDRDNRGAAKKINHFTTTWVSKWWEYCCFEWKWKVHLKIFLLHFISAATGLQRKTTYTKTISFSFLSLIGKLPGERLVNKDYSSLQFSQNNWFRNELFL